MELTVSRHTGLTDIGSSTCSTNLARHSRHHGATVIRATSTAISWRRTMKLYYLQDRDGLQGRDGRPTDIAELRTDISRRLNHSSQHIPTSASTRPSPDDSTQGREEARSAAGVIAARLLAVLVVAMVITSILGFTAFDRQGGNSAAAIASLAIGAASAVLGLSFGFLKAYQVS
jgi:hypothetical protein